MTYADVLLPVPVGGTFTYSIGDSLAAAVSFGTAVAVPFGRGDKVRTGIVVRVHSDKPSFKTKAAYGLASQGRIILPLQYELWKWVAEYYMCHLGEVYDAVTPHGLKAEDAYKPLTETCVALPDCLSTGEGVEEARRTLSRSKSQGAAFDCLVSLCGESGGREVTKEELANSAKCSSAIIRKLEERGLLLTYERKVPRINIGSAQPEIAPPTLSTAQEVAYRGILDGFANKAAVLLHGVTSSGKTEIYTHLIRKAVDEGGQVLLLLPEIALTVQITARLRAFFGADMAVYHSKYSPEERLEIWQKQLSDNPFNVVVGARSAVFLPFQRLSLIIVDEEHETSYKQQDPAPRYHARSVAMVLARLCGAKVLLGSATPSVESYHNAVNGKYGLVELTERYGGVELPGIEVVGTADLRRRKIMKGMLSPALSQAIGGALADGKQAILFLNRRGFAPVLSCADCGWTPRCPHCDIPPTYHKREGLLSCHYCGRGYPLPTVCPECGSGAIRDHGAGTEKIEAEIEEAFPQARVCRMDLDTTRSRGAYERIIGDFSAGNADILIGTQMVAKGLDFGNVGVVGVTDADAMLRLPDFRASEYAFAMMSQVAGRAGRRAGRGSVVIQAMDAGQEVVGWVSRGDYSAFFKHTMAERAEYGYPPFVRLVHIFFKHSKEAVADRAARTMAALIRPVLGSRMLGPDKPAVGRVNSMHFRLIIVKAETGTNLAALRSLLAGARDKTMQDSGNAALHIYFDVDPC